MPACPHSPGVCASEQMQLRRTVCMHLQEAKTPQEADLTPSCEWIKISQVHSSVAVPSAPSTAGGQGAYRRRDSRGRRMALVPDQPAPCLLHRKPLVAQCYHGLSVWFTTTSEPCTLTRSAPAKPLRQCTPNTQTASPLAKPAARPCVRVRTACATGLASVTIGG